MAGSVHIVPVQAIVIILYSSLLFPQLTMTAGIGYTIVPGFQFCFPIIELFMKLYASKLVKFYKSHCKISSFTYICEIKNDF